MRKGIVLITVLILTFIVLIFSAAAIYLSTTSANISGGEKRYKSALEYAKGVSYYLMEEALSGNIKNLVRNHNACIDKECNQLISLPSSIFNSSEYIVNATLLGIASMDEGEIYIFRVNIRNKKAPSEKVIVEFGYKVY